MSKLHLTWEDVSTDPVHCVIVRAKVPGGHLYRTDSYLWLEGRASWIASIAFVPEVVESRWVNQ